MISENDWSRNDGMHKAPDEPDNFLRGQLLASRSTKRQVTADHAAMSYWKQTEIDPDEEMNATVEDAVPPRSQYTERVLQGLVSNVVVEPEKEPYIETDPAIQMESLASILAKSARQKLVTNSILNHIVDKPAPQVFEEYYDEYEDDDTAPRTVHAA